MFCSIGQGLDNCSLDMRHHYLCADPMFICYIARAVEYARIEAALFRVIASRVVGLFCATLRFWSLPQSRFYGVG